MFGKILDTIVNYVIGPTTSIVGIILTIRGLQMQKQTKTIGWSQVQSAAKEISGKIKGFKPDFIICPGQKGGIFAQLLLDELNLQIPIYTGFIVKAGTIIKSNPGENNFCVSTTKWDVYLPSCIKINNTKRVLIVDDYVMSGDFLLSLRQCLQSFDYVDGNIKSCSIATTKVAVGTCKSPNYYWKIAEVGECYFPWGKAK